MTTVKEHDRVVLTADFFTNSGPRRDISAIVRRGAGAA